MFVGFDEYTSGYLVYIPSIQNVVTSVDVIFDKKFITALAYKNRIFREALLTRPLTETFNFNKNNKKTGDITSSYLPPTNSNYEIEEEIQNNLVPSMNDININSNSDDESRYNENINNDIDNTSENNYNFSQELRKSNQISKSPNYYLQEWVSLAKTVQDKKIPWATYGDPNMFIPKPKGIRAVLRMQHTDPTAFKLWTRAIKAEIKNLISQGTFKLEKASDDNFSIPTTLVFKVKLTLAREWDKTKARICVHGDIQGKHEQEDT